MKITLKIPIVLLLIMMTGLACNFPGYEQNEIVVIDDDPADLDPVTTDAPPPSPLGDLPDLVIDEITIDSTTIIREADTWVWITFRVTNIGTGPSPTEFPADMILDGTDTGGYFSVEGGPLQPGESTTHQFAVGHNDTWTLGAHTVEVCVDYHLEIPEIRDDNNFSEPITFDVVAP